MYSVVRGHILEGRKWTHGRPFNTSVYKFCNNILDKGNILKIAQLNSYTHVRILRPPVGATAHTTIHLNSTPFIQIKSEIFGNSI